MRPIQVGDVVDLGDKWLCTCGKEHAMTGGYLAAHWHEEMVHRCNECGVHRTFLSGELIED